MAPTVDKLSTPGAASYTSDTLTVGDGTWDFSKNTFLLPNLQAVGFDTMRYNGMGNRFSTLAQYHRIVLAHGIMAGLVFLLIVPVSVMTVRFYSRQPGYAVVYHAQLQVFASLMLLAVFILGYFAVGPERSLTNPHHGIGVAIFLLFILQLVGGRLIRHITKLRSLRITIHQWSGRAIALLGIVQVPLGLTLYGSPKYLFVLYTLWMTLLLVVYFILSYRSGGRREIYMGEARSEAAHTRITESEYFARDPKPRRGEGITWLGPLAAGGVGTWAWMRGRGQNRGRDRSRSRSRSPSYTHSRGPQAISSRRASNSYFSDKYSQLPSHTGDGGIMKALRDAAAVMGVGKLFPGFMDRRPDRHDERYAAVSVETPRRHRSGRDVPAISELSSEVTGEYSRYPGDGTNTSLLPPSANPPAFSGARSATRGRDSRRPTTPGPMHSRGRAGSEFGEESDYSSYVSPSRRPADGGLAQGVLSGLGIGWFAKKMADRRARREEDRLQEERDMRSGARGSRFTGDGYPSPSRRSPRQAPGRRPGGFGRDTDLSEITESSVVTRPTGASYGAPIRPPPEAGVPSAVLEPPPQGYSVSRPRSRRDLEPVSMPSMPDDPHDVPHSGAGSPYMSSGDSRRAQRQQPRGRSAAERSAGARAEQGRSHRTDREDHGSPQSQPVRVKLKVHDNGGRNVTLRRLTEEEAMATRGPRRHGDTGGSPSELGSPSYGRRYRRDSSQRRAEGAPGRRAEEEDQLAPLSPPNPAFAKGGTRRGKDSGYYSGQAGPSSTTPPAGQTASSLGSPESQATWSGMSMSPSGGERGPDSAAADDRRRRRRQERRAAVSSTTRPSGQDMFE